MTERSQLLDQRTDALTLDFISIATLLDRAVFGLFVAQPNAVVILGCAGKVILRISGENLIEIRVTDRKTFRIQKGWIGVGSWRFPLEKMIRWYLDG